MHLSVSETREAMDGLKVAARLMAGLAAAGMLTGCVAVGYSSGGGWGLSAGR
jgi:hypothetical protein